MESHSEQTWLSLDGISSSLRLSKPTIRLLAKKGCLAVIGKQGTTQARYLDPLPEYKEQLRLGAIIHQRHYPVPAGLSEKALLTQSECAELLGMTHAKMKRYMQEHAVPSIRVDKKHFLYSPLVVRNAMLRRARKTLDHRLAPFLLAEMVEFFRSRLSAEVSIIPTDKEFAADERLQLRLSKIVTESQKSDFARKVKLAQQIVQILAQAKGSLS